MMRKVVGSSKPTACDICNDVLVKWMNDMVKRGANNFMLSPRDSDVIMATVDTETATTRIMKPLMTTTEMNHEMTRISEMIMKAGGKDRKAFEKLAHDRASLCGAEKLERFAYVLSSQFGKRTLAVDLLETYKG